MSDQPTTTDTTPAPARRGRGGIPGNRGGQPGRSGPPGNRNAMKHGAHARLPVSNMPANLRNSQKFSNGLRAVLEDSCVATFGSISVSQASVINVSVTNERLARLWAKRLADGYSKMDDAAVAICTDRIARHTEARDAAIKRLNLDASKTQSVWENIYSRTIPAPALPARETNTIPAANGHAKPATSAETTGSTATDPTDQQHNGAASGASVERQASPQDEGSDQ